MGTLRLSDVDFTPLMIQWRAIMEEDNREARLAGQDGWGIPLAPVTYRPNPSGKPNHTILANNNLTTSWYRELSGPPLLPRGIESRAITAFKTGHFHLDNRWEAVGAWEDVLTTDGRPLLPMHFHGGGHLPIRDLRHVRPQGMARVKAALHTFALKLVGRA